jgi:hypothetical protein
MMRSAGFFNKSDVAARRMGFAQRSNPLKRPEFASASKNAGFAMTRQEKYRAVKRLC